MKSESPKYTVALAKGQGMIDETMALFSVWKPGMKASELGTRAVQNAVFGRATAKRIGQYAAGDPELLALVQELRDRAETHTVAYSVTALKMEHSHSWHVLQSRDAMGRAMRRQSRDDQSEPTQADGRGRL